ncbi:hypothetical protein C8R43DRAFT_1119702 [Mycena crocata]|nr:hypothetical protein C8R43DRAFT_1119702 [Mycena crocata]
MAHYPSIASGAAPAASAATTFAGSDAERVAALNALQAAMTVLSQAVASPPASSAAGAVGSQTSAANPPAPVPAPAFLTRGPWVAGAVYLVVPTGPLQHIHEDPASTELWYCITKGRYVGVILSHALAVAAVTGIGAGTMKSYKTQTLAVAAFNEMLQYRMVTTA